MSREMNILKNYNKRLQELLEDPHEGLITWNSCVADCLRSMVSLLGTPEKKVNWENLRCEEASMFSINSYVACGKLASSIIWHNKDRKAYAMCDMCADHNVKNRGGIELAKKGIEV